MLSGLHRIYGVQICTLSPASVTGACFFSTPRAPAIASFLSRFSDFNLWTTKKRVESLRGMHRNPVRRGLVESPEHWHWSSCRFYLLDEAGPVRVNEGWTKISFRDRAA